MVTTNKNTRASRSPQGNRALGAGATLAVSVGLFAFGGQWMDRQLGTKPWFLLLFVLSGIVGGILHLIRVAAPDMYPFGKPAKDHKQETQEQQIDGGAQQGSPPKDSAPKHDSSASKRSQ